MCENRRSECEMELSAISNGRLGAFITQSYVTDIQVNVDTRKGTESRNSRADEQETNEAKKKRLMDVHQAELAAAQADADRSRSNILIER
jgi:hypothetical protein